ncbi:hypothetical protein ORI20_32980, partial [Mycobacterium sp. CVI_P3]|nr:hypothetical protein [Mycobacterium pinniadriaticum]MCX2941489.1 hypothetical protein [Mycobacterium pinniadriaticum]
PFKLVGIIFPCHRGGSSRFPRQSCGIKRVQHTGAGPLRGSALGFRNLTNYIARSLLETGGFKPQLHRQS